MAFPPTDFSCIYISSLIVIKSKKKLKIGKKKKYK